jgi:hypothetical protein
MLIIMLIIIMIIMIIKKKKEKTGSVRLNKSLRVEIKELWAIEKLVSRRRVN